MKEWIPYTLSAVGLVFAATGTVLLPIFPSIMDKMIGAKLVISPDSPLIEDFISPKSPIFKKFYMFNVTNPQTILAGGKPVLEQVGPFTYFEKRHKHDLNWTDDTVEYLENAKFFFVPEMSNGLTEDVLITSLNPVLISAAAFMEELNSPLSPFIHSLFKLIRQQLNLKVFISRKVGEWLFRGYEDHFLRLIYKLTGNSQYETGKFAHFYAMNESDGGKYSVFTGSSGLDSLQVINEFEGSKTLGVWSDPFCDMINGTTGTQFPLPVSTHTNISIFSSDLCRSVYLTFEKKVTHGGLELYRYNIPLELLVSGAENECFCVSPNDFTCRTSLHNLTPCRNGLSLIASLPHFYMADDDVVASVDGMSPSKDNHETYTDVEPNTGMTFSAVNRYQINMPLKPYAVLPDLAYVDTVILPLFWVNESMEVPETKARQLHERLTTPFKISDWVSFSLCAVGAVFTLVSLLTLLIQNDRKLKLQHFENFYGDSSEENDFPESEKCENFSHGDESLHEKIVASPDKKRELPSF